MAKTEREGKRRITVRIDKRAKAVLKSHPSMLDTMLYCRQRWIQKNGPEPVCGPVPRFSPYEQAGVLATIWLPIEVYKWYRDSASACNVSLSRFVEWFMLGE